jgi:hypothetical protein
MNDPDDYDLPERLGRIYGSKEALKEKIRAMEARVVRSTRAIIKAGPHLQDDELLRGLEMDLEWFLTWRLKLEDTSTVMWCDGVIDLAFQVRGDRSYEINARAYIGPESDATTTLCALDGTIVLDETADQLKGYRLNITCEDRAFAITEAI